MRMIRILSAITLLVACASAQAMYFDDETQLDYNGARDYNPLTGRYIQSDPIGLRGGNFSTYGYANGNPVSRIDPFGLFSPGAHDKIIQNSLGDRLNPADIGIIQKASRDFDTSTQSSSESPMHSMRSKGQSINDAERVRDEFIRRALAEARAMNQQGNRSGALKRFGEACHPIMDWSSKEHTDSQGHPKEWNPYWPFGHSPNDSIGNETVHDLTPDILKTQRNLLNNAYDSVFGK